MTLYRDYKTDPEVEQNGVWFPYGEDVKILLARAGGANKKFQRCGDKAATKYKRELDMNRLPAEEANQAVVEMYADSVVMDWKNVTDENDESLAFNRENVIKVLTDLPDLFRRVQEDAQNMQVYKEYRDGEDSKN